MLNMFHILIDADGCPVVGQTIDMAQEYQVPVILVCDTSHIFHEPYATLLMADKGKDQSDFLLLKHAHAGDIVITQDYGLASLALAKGAIPLSQNGLRYHEGNMDQLLQSRHEHAKMRKHKQYGHIPKRTAQADIDFMDTLETILLEKLEK